MPSKDLSKNRALAAHARSELQKRVQDRPHVAPKQRPAGDRLLLKAEVLDRTKVGYTTLWSMMRRGQFPLSVSLGRRVGWFESEVDNWLAALPRVELKGGNGDA
jgi:prophage regulatory protein